MLLTVMIYVVAADGVYHSDHIEFDAVGDHPLRSGFVQNIHAIGPQIYAVERSVLNGASPNMEYYIQPRVNLGNAGCTGALISRPHDNSILTNCAANGTTLIILGPEVAAGLAGLTINVRWELLAGAPIS